MRAWKRGAVLAAAVGMGWAMGPAPSEAVCRVVLPPRDAADPGVPFDPTTAAIYVLTPNVVVDWQCPARDGGVDVDGGIDVDGGLDLDGGVGLDGGDSSDAGDPMGAAPDAGDPDAGESIAGDPDAGEPIADDHDAGDHDAGDLDGGLPDGSVDLDAGAPDPSVCPDGTPAIEIRDTLLSIVVQPSILATGGTAGLIMPVPGRPDVSVGSTRFFEDVVASMRAEVQETVEVREDPNLGFQCSDPHWSSDATDALIGAPLMLYGCDGAGGYYADGGSAFYRPGTEGREPQITTYDGGTVRYETFPSTEAYDVSVVNASSLEALTTWLDERGFAHDEDDDAAFEAYVADGSWFVAVHVHPPDTGESLALAPLVVTWRGDELPITHRLQYDPDGGFLFTDAFVIAPTRMDPTDGSGWIEYAAPADFTGTSLEGFGARRGWLTRVSINRRSSENIPDAVFAPANLGQEVRPVIERLVQASIAAPCCVGSSLTTTDPAAFETFVYTRTYLEGEEPPIPPAWLGSTPPLEGRWCDYGYDWGGGSGAGGYDSSCSGRSTSRDGRPLRGCTAAREDRWGAIAGGWGPIVLAVLWVVWRSRRR